MACRKSCFSSYPMASSQPTPTTSQGGLSSWPPGTTRRIYRRRLRMNCGSLYHPSNVTLAPRVSPNSVLVLYTQCPRPTYLLHRLLYQLTGRVDTVWTWVGTTPPQCGER